MTLLQGIALTLRIVVALVIVLLLLACVSLLRRSSRRYAFAIAAFAASGILSLAWVIAIPAVDNMVVQQLVSATGIIVALLVPDVICSTIWPWLMLVISLAGIAMAMRRLHAERSNGKEPVSASNDAQESAQESVE